MSKLKPKRRKVRQRKPATQLELDWVELSARAGPPSIDAMLSLLAIDEFDWQLLVLRYWEAHTLQAIADWESVNLTRERVRQRILRCIERCRKRAGALGPALEAMETAAKRLGDPLFEMLAPDRALLRVVGSLTYSGFDDARPTNLVRLFSALRGVVNKYPMEFTKAYPKATYFICAINPPVTQHTGVAEGLQRAQDKNRSWSYIELARKVLEDAGEPLHWSVIAQRAEKIGHKSTFYSRSLHNALVCHDIFVWQEQGTYGLASWGMNRARYTLEILQSVLHQEGKALPEERIRELANRERSVEDSSLLIYLTLHPGFYRSREGTYGLREWLPPRHKQTLATPKWLIESPASYKRLSNQSEPETKVVFPALTQHHSD